MIASELLTKAPGDLTGSPVNGESHHSEKNHSTGNGGGVEFGEQRADIGKHVKHVLAQPSGDEQGHFAEHGAVTYHWDDYQPAQQEVPVTKVEFQGARRVKINWQQRHQG